MKKKNKMIIVIALIAVIVVAGVWIAIELLGSGHEHSFGEWKLKTPAQCSSAEIQARTCKCGEEETREGAPATGHTYVSISAESKLEKPMASMTVQVSDLKITAACEICGESMEITEGVSLENAKLSLGENKITVKYGALSTILTLQAAELNTALDGVICDDTYVSSDKKDDEFTGKDKMGTSSSSFRIYLRTNISDILANEMFLENKDQAKVQLVFAITDGKVTEDTTFTLKAYKPVAGITDVDFSELTWNEVDNKEDTSGVYSQLHWHNGTALVSSGIGHNVSADKDSIVITLGYSQIADYIDENGNILFAFATNTSGLKIGSLENKTEENRPAFKVILNNAHFHIFDREVAEDQYFVSAGCKEKAKYYLSCACGGASVETFKYGEVIDHAYGKAISEKPNTCTTAGVKEHYQCSRCGKYFLYRDGQMKLVKAEDVKLSADHDYKLIPAKAATCTETGNCKYYKCGLCGAYFDEQKNPTTKEAQKLQKLEHTYSDLIPEQAKTCTEDGVKAHYECEACGKTFLEKDGEMKLVKAADLKISAGHDTKVIGAKEPTCTKDGNNKYYQCKDCGKYFVDKEGTTETTKETQKLQKVDHTYSDLIPEQAKTCREDGVKAHYECEACGKTFLEKDGEMKLVKAADLKISAGHDTKVIGAKEPTCTKSGNNKYYQCKLCSKYFTDKEGTTETTKDVQKIDALGHNYTSITAVSNLDNPMETMIVTPSDLSVTGTCGVCGESCKIVEGIELAGTTLVLGENVITVKYGALSTELTIEATELYIVLEGNVADDTYVYSSGKSKSYTDKEELGTLSSSYRSYLRVNVRDILDNQQLLENRDRAKVQLVLSVTSGNVTNTTKYTLKTYAPTAGITDAEFSSLTWNSVDNKEGSVGAYSALNWGNGTELSPDVIVENSKIIIELDYDQIESYIDEDGNILFAFATNTSGLKVGSVENATEANKPAFKVVIKG